MVFEKREEFGCRQRPGSIRIERLKDTIELSRRHFLLREFEHPAEEHIAYLLDTDASVPGCTSALTTATSMVVHHGVPREEVAPLLSVAPVARGRPALPDEVQLGGTELRRSDAWHGR